MVCHYFPALISLFPHVTYHKALLLLLPLPLPSPQGYDPSNGPNYLTAAAKPSPLPTRHFCSVCGYWGLYACTRCGMRYCCGKCAETHKETRCLKFATG